MDRSVFAARSHAAQMRMTTAATEIAELVGFSAGSWAFGKSDAAQVVWLEQMAELLETVSKTMTESKEAGKTTKREGKGA